MWNQQLDEEGSGAHAAGDYRYTGDNCTPGCTTGDSRPSNGSDDHSPAASGDHSCSASDDHSPPACDDHPSTGAGRGASATDHQTIAAGYHSPTPTSGHDGAADHGADDQLHPAGGPGRPRRGQLWRPDRW